jgi:plastocyanin
LVPVIIKKRINLKILLIILKFMNKKVKIVLILAVVAAAVILFILVTRNNSSVDKTTDLGGQSIPEEMMENQSEEAAVETKKLIDEVIADQGGLENANIINIGAPAEIIDGEEGVSTPVKTIQAIEIVPGGSLVDINSGNVIKSDGAKVDNAAPAASQEAPSQSVPLSSEDTLPKSTIKLDVTSNSFTPATFTVKRGQVVTLAIANVNETTFSEIFRFDDPSLSAVVVGIAKGETKSIVFNAPSTAGEYSFYSSMFNHRDLGAVGKMIVQ